MPDPPPIPKTLQVTSSAYKPGEPIPKQHTCDGPDKSPPISIANVPPNAKAFAIIMDDPDARDRTWIHWTAWNIPAATTQIPEGASIGKLGGRQGLTDNGDVGYGGPCPPPGKPHRYFLKVYALSEPLDVSAGAHPPLFFGAMRGKVLAWGEHMGTFKR